MGVHQVTFETKLGCLHLSSSDRGLRRVHWDLLSFKSSSAKRGSPAIDWAEIACQQLGQYFKGERTHFDLPLDLEGTDFQLKVWRELQKIPYGQTAFYKDIAVKIANPRAVRAVGMANHKNPLSIIIPCHRVIRANGELGGYAGGLQRKEALLQLEKGAFFTSHKARKPV